MSRESIEDLYARWRSSPDAAQTRALCMALRGGLRPDLVEIVGHHASKQLDVGALVAAAEMYTDSGRLEDAQSALVTAGRIAPHDGNVYRLLGEVLLRRGDAERAAKVLERAVQLGVDDGARPLLERARSLVPTQRASGNVAVAAAVAPSISRDVPPSTSGGALDAGDPDATMARLAAPDEDDETAIRKSDEVRTATVAAVGVNPAPMPAAIRLPPPSAPPRRAPLLDGGRRDAPQGGEIIFTTPTRSLGFDIQPSTGHNELRSPDELASGVAPPSAGSRVAASTAAFGSPSRRTDDVVPDSALPLKTAGGPRGAPVEPPVNPLLLEALARPSATLGGALVPEPRDVLEALQIAGIYEPAERAQLHAWTKPERVRRWFSVVTLVGLALVLVAAGAGTYSYVNRQRAKAHVEAERLLADVDRDLHASDAKRLDRAETMISRSFELESRSAHAALTWLHERALVGLLKGGADLAFEDAVQRARAVGVEESRVAFAHVASFLFQGDTAGAAATVAKWDSVAENDPWFQMLAGSTFERAGDPRAVERYGVAAKLDPELVLAQVLLARATAVDGDHRRAVELSRDFRARYPDRVEGAALVVLAWTRDPLRGDPPPEVRDLAERGESLPIPLRSIPHAARAVVAIQRGAVEDARPWIQKGLDVVDTPGVAAWLGSIALATGDENLARRGALVAVSFSAMYPPARVLAARVALLGGRLDEALKATEELPQGLPDVALVTAAASYERLDGDRMGHAFDAVPDDAKRLPFAQPLVRGQSLLSGNLTGMSSEKLLDMADDEAPWADLVAMDWALDAGDIELARRIADPWRGEPRPTRAIRLARLARYDGRLEEADKYSRLALARGTVTLRALSERVFTLVALKRDGEVAALFKSYPNVGGPLAKWLRAYAAAAHGKLDEARAIVSQEDPPPSAAPMPSRLIAASAYAMMRDVRHGSEYARAIVRAGFANPDVAFAAERLGLGKVVRKPKW